jgi:hypothetical protein
MTDLEEYGLGRGRIAIGGRRLLVTVDFDGFTPENGPSWCQAMRLWAERLRRSPWKPALFVALENVVRLQRGNGAAHAEFLAALRELARAGAALYPHNHGAFDPDTGRPLSPGGDQSPAPGEYRKRPSMYYDVVHRNGLPIAAWLGVLRGLYEELLRGVACPRPRMLAFRAGGWDTGGSRNDLERYLNGLTASGFAVDSSASRGVFGTPSWRIGAPFGANVFRCGEGLIEVAPCWAVEWILDPLAPATWAALSQLREHGRLWTGGRGVFVVVLHFDHLFHRRAGDGYDAFAVRDRSAVARRIGRMFGLMAALQRCLRLRPVGLDELAADLGLAG